VAELLLSQQKLDGGRTRYDLALERGDSIEYTHLNRFKSNINVGSAMTGIIKAFTGHIRSPTWNKIEPTVSKNESKVKFDMNASPLHFSPSGARSS
jgi:hypothetical protein